MGMTGWSPCVSLRNNDSKNTEWEPSNECDMGFSHVSALAICGEGQRESSTTASQRSEVGWALFLKTLFLITNSVWSEVGVTSREWYCCH